MSRPLRFRIAAVLVFAGLSTSPASSNPFTALFNSASEEAPAPAPAQDAPAKDAPAKDECLSRPGKPIDGQHWMYRLDGHRRCWFLVSEEAATSRKRAHHHAIKRRLASSDEDETVPRKRKAVVDARAELMRPAPDETLQPTPVPAVKVVDAAPSVPATPATGAAALVPAPPVLAKPDQPPSENPDMPQDVNPRQDNVETLLAATPANSEAVAGSTPPQISADVPVVTGEDAPWWTARWLGPLLMALGLISLLIATSPLRMVVGLAQGLRAPEPEDRLESLPSESDSRAGPGRHGHAPAMRHAARQIVEHQRRSTSPVQGSPEITFQEAIRALTDFDAASAEARHGSLTARRLDAAPVSRRTRTYASRMS